MQVGNSSMDILRDKELERSVASVADIWAKVSGLPKDKSMFQNTTRCRMGCEIGCTGS